MKCFNLNEGVCVMFCCALSSIPTPRTNCVVVSNFISKLQKIKDPLYFLLSMYLPISRSNKTTRVLYA